MVEADIHLRPLHTSLVDIYKVFEPLVCCLKGIWVHPYTVTPAKLAPDLGIQVHLRCGIDAITSWLRLIFTSDHFIHPYKTYTKLFEPLVCCLKGIWLHPYTVIPAKLAPDLGIQVHLRSGNDATTSCLRQMSTSDHFIHPY
jgi:hypothetical protein